MIRMILISALAFIIPFIVWYAAARARGHEGRAPIALLSLAGAACVMVTVTALALFASGDPDQAQDYTPPRIERERALPGHLGPSGDSPGRHRTPGEDVPREPAREPAPERARDDDRERESEPEPEPSPSPDR
ncbi:MAG: hypothetical protein ACXIVL_11845 [Oceanicaulis sp.]